MLYPYRSRKGVKKTNKYCFFVLNAYFTLFDFLYCRFCWSCCFFCCCCLCCCCCCCCHCCFILLMLRGGARGALSPCLNPAWRGVGGLFSIATNGQKFEASFVTLYTQPNVLQAKQLKNPSNLLPYSTSVSIRTQPHY